MTKRRPHRRGVLLIELLAMILIGLAMLFVLSRMIINHFEFQHLSRLHDNRMGVMDTLAHRLERDTLATTAYQWQPDSATLTLERQAPALAVQYRIEPATVARLVDGAETDSWRSVRLQFDANVEIGTRADVFRLTFTEQPPPRRTRLRNRSYTKSIALPATGGRGDAAEGTP